MLCSSCAAAPPVPGNLLVQNDRRALAIRKAGEPSLSVRMIGACAFYGSDHVLEIGTGLGFQTALRPPGPQRDQH